MFSIAGGAFAPQQATVTLNGAPVESANISQTSSFVFVPFGIADGMNDITFSALDTSGAKIEREMTVWGGSRSFTVNVIDPLNFALSGMAVSVQAVGELLTLTGFTSPGGSLTFFNVPAVPLVSRSRARGT